MLFLYIDVLVGEMVDDDFFEEKLEPAVEIEDK